VTLDGELLSEDELAGEIGEVVTGRPPA